MPSLRVARRTSMGSRRRLSARTDGVGVQRQHQRGEHVQARRRRAAPAGRLRRRAAILRRSRPASCGRRRPSDSTNSTRLVRARRFIRWCWLVHSSVSQSANPTHTMSRPSRRGWSLIAAMIPGGAAPVPMWRSRLLLGAGLRSGNAELDTLDARGCRHTEHDRPSLRAPAGAGADGRPAVRLRAPERPGRRRGACRPDGQERDGRAPRPSAPPSPGAAAALQTGRHALRAGRRRAVARGSPGGSRRCERARRHGF